MKKFLLLILFLISLTSCMSIEKRKEFFNKKEYIFIKNNNKTSIILVLDNGNFYGYSGLNNYFGNYKVDGNKIKFERLGITLMSGDLDKIEAEKNFLTNFDKICSYKIKKNMLIFKLTTREEMCFLLK